ncbi:hypothetical protein ACFVG1_08675 [Streptomyces bacillaris]|uniref:hypothetical protein n=1 Tax=Streptomyces bacillaris TaxID=68179 RepID=UPI0035DFED7C
MSSRIPQPTPQYEQTVRTPAASGLGPDVVLGPAPGPGPDVVLGPGPGPGPSPVPASDVPDPGPSPVPAPDVPAPGSASAPDAVNETPFPLSRPLSPPPPANTG